MRYETGTKNKVIRSAIEYAIRDQLALIDAHLNYNGEAITEDAKEVIDSCDALIRDFLKLKGTLK